MSKRLAARLIDIWSALVFIVIVAWAAMPTRLFINPQSVQIDGYQVTVARTFPLADYFRIPVIRYRETVREIGSSAPCVDTAEFRYEDNGTAFGQWNIERWAAPCMTGDYLWRASWSARLFGIIPLRPVELDHIVIRDR